MEICMHVNVEMVMYVHISVLFNKKCGECIYFIRALYFITSITKMYDGITVMLLMDTSCTLMHNLVRLKEKCRLSS